MTNEEIKKEPPPSCDQEIYEKGNGFFVTHSLGMHNVEKFVRMAAEKSGLRMDWHYVGGRAVIKTLDDVAKSLDALVEFREFHDEAYRENCPGSLLESQAMVEHTEEIIRGIWRYNGVE